VMSAVWNYIRTHWFSISLILGVAWFAALRAYYWVKPWMPDLLHLNLRRWWAKRTLQRCNGDWPILESAGEKP